MIPTQLAINSVTTRNADVQACVTAYADAGFRNVEFMLGHVKDYLTAGHRAGDLRTRLDHLELRCIGGFEAPLACFAGADELRTNHALHRGNASLIAELGGTVMVVGTDGPPNGVTVEDPIGHSPRSLPKSPTRSRRRA